MQPHPDCNWPEMLRDGTSYRAGRRLPPITIPNFWNRFQQFVHDFILPEFKKEFVEMDEHLDLEEWLALTHYPDWRKDELREEWKKLMRINDRRNFIVKLFMKDEHYDAFKHGRGIYARIDAAKIIFGPLVKKIEQIVYKHTSFIKHVSVEDRPKYIFEKLFGPGKKYFATDFSSMEAHFTPEMYSYIEYFIYRSFLLPGDNYQNLILNLMEIVVSGTNVIKNKFFNGEIDARRMSGEMTTSLGNGLINYCLIKFYAHLRGVEVDCVVEGDDGLVSVPADFDCDPAMFRAMGCIIKLEVHENLETAGFCQNYFDSVSFRNIVDPRKIISNLGWTKQRYIRAKYTTKMQLLRAKALSLLYQTPGCPVVHVLATKILQLTSGYNMGKAASKLFSSYWHSDMWTNILSMDLNEKLNTPILESSRLVMMEKFNIPIPTQLKIEKEIRDWKLGSNTSATMLALMPDTWVCNYNEYVFDGEDLELLSFF